MSAFYRFIFSTFLILALSCFCVSSAFSDTTYTYYKSNSSETCRLDQQSMCSSFSPITLTCGSNTPVGSQTVSCGSEMGSVSYYQACIRTYQGQTYPADVSSTSFAKYSKKTHTCPTGQTFKLDGCTATCVPDPCNVLKDNEETALVTCGTASCPNGSHFEAIGNTQGCTNGEKTSFVPTPAPITSINGCSAVLKAGIAVPTSAKIKLSETGSSAQAYCSTTYVHQGVSTPPLDDVPNDLASLSFLGVTPTTEAGSCPDGTVKGQLNGQWVCVPDSQAGEGSGCGTGMIKDNSGTCVPFSQAGTGSGTGDGTGSGDGTGTGTGDGSGSGSGGSGSGSGGSGSGSGSGGGGSGVCDPQTGTGCAPEGTENAGEGGSYSGSVGCENAPDCTGDVVQCGLIHQQWQSGCDLQKNLTGIPEGGGSQYSEVGTNTNDPRVSAAVGTLTGYSNQIKGFLVPPSSGSCPADFSVSVMNHSIVIPLSKACPLFQFMRFLLHLIVNLMCLRILYSSFVRV